MKGLRGQRGQKALAVAMAIVVTAGCRAATNYSNVLTPRYASPRAVARAATEPAVRTPDALRVVTFNVKWAVHTDRALDLLRSDPDLRQADVIALQEMDERGVRFLADSLGLSYVYYPATLHPRVGRDVGNAILTRWPIVDDRKIVLPHLARGYRTARAAVGATLLVGNRSVRVYSLHLATLIGNGPNQRREQLAAVLADADSFPLVVMAGDFNSETVPGIAESRGYAWPTRGLPSTNTFWTFDHILLRGLWIAGPGATGVVQDNRRASDHRPVWAVVTLGPA